MTTAATQSSVNSGRSIRFLAELDISADSLQHQEFAERLAQLIDLSSSLKIARTHSTLPALNFKPAEVNALEATTGFLQMHERIVDGILESFTPSEKLLWAELPNGKSLELEDVNLALKPYLDFYLLHQKQIIAKVKKLRSAVREAAMGISKELAQLAALDTVLDDTLLYHSRNTFAQVSKILQQRFTPLLIDDSGDKQDIHHHISNDLQALLLAEVEAHMLPVLGLVEAINEETK